MFLEKRCSSVHKQKTLFFISFIFTMVLGRVLGRIFGFEYLDSGIEWAGAANILKILATIHILMIVLNMRGRQS